jgi:hypothetical protein
MMGSMLTMMIMIYNMALHPIVYASFGLIKLILIILMITHCIYGNWRKHVMVNTMDGKLP